MSIYALGPIVLTVLVFIAAFAMRARLNKKGLEMYAALGGPQGSAAIGSATKGDLTAYTLLLQNTTDLDARGFLANIGGRRARVDAVAAWVGAQPHNADALLTWGSSLIGQAWAHRGHGVKVSERGRQGFRDHLVQADEVLQRAATARPDDPTPWALRITCARGLGCGAQHLQALHAQAIARDPECWLAHVEMLVALTAKWGGSDEAMIGFARAVSGSAPHGSDLHTLVILAHIERWTGMELIAGDRGAAKRYLTNPAVHGECVAAYDRSLGSAQLRTRMSTQVARNYAGAWFFLAKDKPRLRSEVMAIGNAFTDLPWGYLGDSPEEGYRRASQWAYGL